ncbi:MAG: HNH endonuclease [Anaerolineae bacterium]|nr:HNH endonuclease [Anaerolineae bacterium]
MKENRAVVEEIKWRRDLLVEIGGKVSNYGVNPPTLRDWRIYGGQQGIWIDKQRTAALTDDGNGLAVSLLHKGSVYPDDFSETGVIYHYPVTNRPSSRDLGEIEAVKNCNRLKIPVFVITVSEADPSLRDVYFGYVTMWDDRAKIFIVEFGIDQKTVTTEETERPFELTVHEHKEKYEAAKGSGQAAFRIAVIHRYGAQCAVCEMAVIELLDAAHLVSKAENGSDDPRNGLPLCALHHRAFDAGLFSIRPDTSVVTKPLGPSKAELNITKDNLDHTKAKPHITALNYCWEKWLKENRS